MADYPTLDAMNRPWREPEVYCGPARTVPPVLAYDGGQVGTVTVRAGWVAAEKRRPWHNGNDSFALWADPGGAVCLLAVADGVADGESAGRASRAATMCAVQACRQRLTETTEAAGSSAETLAAVLRGLFGDVDVTLSKREPDEPAYRTTLTVALLPTVVPPGGAISAVVARVGDSPAWRIRSGSFESIFEVAGPGAGGTTATYALPGHCHRLEIRTVRMLDGEVLALTTDGLANGIPGERVTGFLEPLWAAPPTPLEFLATLAVRRNDRDDDRAAAVAWLGHYEHRASGDGRRTPHGSVG